MLGPENAPGAPQGLHGQKEDKAAPGCPYLFRILQCPDQTERGPSRAVVTDRQTLAALVAGRDPPRAIFELRSYQKFLAALNCRIVGVGASQGEHIKRLPGGQRVGGTILELPPAAVGVLLFEELLHQRR